MTTRRRIFTLPMAKTRPSSTLRHWPPSAGPCLGGPPHWCLNGLPYTAANSWRTGNDVRHGRNCSRLLPWTKVAGTLAGDGSTGRRGLYTPRHLCRRNCRAGSLWRRDLGPTTRRLCRTSRCSRVRSSFCRTRRGHLARRARLSTRCDVRRHYGHRRVAIDLGARLRSILDHAPAGKPHEQASRRPAARWGLAILGCGLQPPAERQERAGSSHRRAPPTPCNNPMESCRGGAAQDRALRDLADTT